MPHLLRRGFETVVELGRRALALNPALTSTYKDILAPLGRTDAAHAVRAQLLALDPAFRIRDTAAPLTRAEDCVLYAGGLRRGAPD